jgi:hypothetical protein
MEHALRQVRVGFAAMRTTYAALAAVLATLALSSVARAAPPGYQDCSSRYWAAGSFEVAVRHMSCASASYVLQGGLAPHHNLRRGGFKCSRERNAENVVWVYFCHSGSRRLFFDTY